jgi:Ssp1 endopeptidase immunity protein Rap1a
MRAGTLRFLVAVAVVSACMQPSCAIAETSASQLLAMCEAVSPTLQSDDQGINELQCFAHLEGMLSAAYFLKSVDPQMKEFACVPYEHVGLRQLVLIYTKYAKEHPQWLHVQAAGMFFMAMRDAFPCPK